MAIVISGVNNNDKITAADGNIDLLSAVNYASPITVTDLTASNKISCKFIDVNTTIQLGVSGVATATTFVGNLTGNVNQTSTLLLQIAGSEKFRIASSGQLGIGGANYGTSGQVLTSGGSGSAATWSTINSDAINEGNTKAEVIDSGSDGRFIVETEGSERVRIDSNGRIIQNYAALSSVSSNLPYAYFAPTKQNYGGVDMTMNLHDDASNALGNGGGIGFSANNSSGSPIVRGAIRGNTEATNSTAGYLTLHTRDAGGNNTEKVRIASNGDVTASHSGLAVNIFESTDNHSRFRIRSGSSSLAQLEFADQDDADAGEIRYDHTNDKMTFHVGNNTERVGISSTGSVGIAQTNPSKARLHVVGDNTSGDIVAKFKSGGSGANSETYIALVTGYPDDANDFEGHAHIGVQRNGATNGTSLVFKPHSGSGTSVTERMRITPTGSVTKPQQPYVYISGITNTGGAGNANNGTATTYGAITYSAGRVTAQVEGNYLITFSSISDNGSGRIDTNIRVNGTNIVNMLTSNNGTGYRQTGSSIVYHLNVNDYVDWYHEDWYASSSTSTAWRTASVYLLG